ncbi:MAG: DUF2007 domain-containing protein [Chloroflexi bacterium]|nr:DUF2007 domain-containing protein [Chloroflexota bacterium]
MKKRHESRAAPPVRIGTAEDEAEADLWRAILQGEGIPCLVKDRNPLQHYWLGPKPFARFTFEVYVPASAAEQARAILKPSLRKRRRRPFTPAVKAWSAWATATFFAGVLGLLILLLVRALR